MSTELHRPIPIREGSGDSLSPAQVETLQRGVAKIVAIGEQVGVSTDQMIEMLRSGLTVRDLLEYLAARSGDVA